MKRTQLLSFVLMAGCSGFMVGCQPSEEEMATMMKQPPRQAELERLEDFVGTWKADFQVDVVDGDEVKTNSGQNTIQWAAGKSMLVEHWEHDMGDGNIMKGVILISWDRFAGKYRVMGTDNYGGRFEGTMAYDQEEKIWKAKSKGRDGITGEQVVEKWTAKFTDPSTNEWTWAQYDGLGLFKNMEATGTSRRQ